MILRRALPLLLVVLALWPGAVRAGEGPGPIDLAGEVTVDIVGVVAGGGDGRLRVLSNVDLFADLDLVRLVGWRGARAHFDLLDNRGARPNDSAGTLQGVNNIEVAGAGLRLFEAWVEQDLGRGASLRVGLYDLNSEFYSTDSAGLLIAPPFGIGSELSATGPNGPSIFPSSALAARLYVPVGRSGSFVRLGAINARAQTLGDPGGVDFSFREGLLLIGEAGHSGKRVRSALGLWTYTRGREDLAETDTGGLPLRKASNGVYATVEGDLLASGGRQLTTFLRVGFSSPHDTPYRAGLQAGFLLAPALTARADSQLSLGLHRAWLSDHYRAAISAAGGDPASETALELTYADSLIGRLIVQPDLQWVFNPGGDRAARNALVGTVRLAWGF